MAIAKYCIGVQSEMVGVVLEGSVMTSCVAHESQGGSFVASARAVFCLLGVGSGSFADAKQQARPYFISLLYSSSLLHHRRKLSR